jgi:hypothetical protein
MDRALYVLVKKFRTARATGPLIALAAGAALLLGGCSSRDRTPTAPPPPPPPPPAAVKHVRVTPETSMLPQDSAETLSASVIDTTGIRIASDTVFTWTSSDTTIATVTAGGMVTGRTPGIATITATSAASLSGTATVTVTPRPIQHVVIVGLLELNQADVFPATGASPMPFLDSLSKAGARMTRYSGNSVPSIGNFYMLMTGDTVTSNDNDTTTFTGSNLIRSLLSAGRTWRSYAESIPSTGYLGPDNGLYVRHHNVAALISDVRTDATQRQNLVSTTQLSADIAANRLPNFAMIVPNECHNSHRCSLDSVDAWLRTTLTPLLQSAEFRQSGLLVILADRARTSVGGTVPWVATSSFVRAGTVDATAFQHQSTLRLAANALGITTVMGAGASAPDMKTSLTMP